MKYIIRIKIEEIDDNGDNTNKDFGGWIVGSYATLEEAADEVKERFTGPR